jgi:hypothetical protein
MAKTVAAATIASAVQKVGAIAPMNASRAA